MKIENIYMEIDQEMRRAKDKFPQWSLDPVHGAAIVAEEAGEALQASLDFYYGRSGSHKLKKELIHTATMAIRFLLNLEESEKWVVENLGLREVKNGRKL